MIPSVMQLEKFAEAVERVDEDDIGVPAFEHAPEEPRRTRHWVRDASGLLTEQPRNDCEDGVELTGEVALAFRVFRASAKTLEAVTQKARNDIESAQKQYREALAEFTRLSVASEG